MLEIRRRTLGPEHPQTLVSTYGLAPLLLASPDASDHDRALGLVRAVADLCPADQNFWKWLGAVEYRQGHWDAAIRATEKGIEARGARVNPFMYLTLASAHARRGEMDQAREWYTKARPWVEGGGIAVPQSWLVDETKALLGVTLPPGGVNEAPISKEASPPG